MNWLVNEIVLTFRGCWLNRLEINGHNISNFKMFHQKRWTYIKICGKILRTASSERWYRGVTALFFWMFRNFVIKSWEFIFKNCYKCLLKYSSEVLNFGFKYPLWVELVTKILICSNSGLWLGGGKISTTLWSLNEFPVRNLMGKKRCHSMNQWKITAFKSKKVT